MSGMNRCMCVLCSPRKRSVILRSVILFQNQHLIQRERSYGVTTFIGIMQCFNNVFLHHPSFLDHKCVENEQSYLIYTVALLFGGGGLRRHLALFCWPGTHCVDYTGFICVAPCFSFPREGITGVLHCSQASVSGHLLVRLLFWHTLHAQ